MSLFCDINSLVTESDVEQKLIYPLLTSDQGLGYNDEEIKTKHYLSPYDIDKGAGKKVGYYPDYAIFLSSLMSIVVEAKSPQDSVDAGFREAQLYAHHINKEFPEGINPVKYVLACNGKELLYGSWDNASPRKINCSNLTVGASEYHDFISKCRRSSILASAESIRSLLSPSERFKALKLLGGPAKQNLELPPNRFAHDLVPVLRRYFDIGTSRSSKEIIERGYVATSERTKYDSLLEALLKDNLARFKYPLIEPIETSRSDAPNINKTLKQLMAEDDTMQNSLLLLIGGVGSGKSFFIDRYYHFLMSQDIKENTLWAFIDFNTAPADLHNLEDWMIPVILEELQVRNKINDFYDYNNLRRYFAPQIAERERGPYKILKEKQPDEYERRIADDLVKWRDDLKGFLKGVMRYHMGDRGSKVVVVFDNADRRDAEQQLAVFQAAQHLRSEYGPLCIMALRDETYERYKNEPPLDAYLKPFTFQITPPRFIDVVKKRLQMVIEYLANTAPKKLSYELSNGVVIEYPATELGKYLMGVYKSIFNPTRRVRLILEALAGRNVRNTLQMFAEIIMSGYMADEHIFSARYSKGEVDLPEWLIIRILMRTKYRYFTSQHGYVLNLFDIDEDSKTTSNFLLFDILLFLSQSRKKQGELGIEGYRHVHVIFKKLTTYGYLTEDILWGLDYLADHGLIIADNQCTKGITRDDYIKITASGHYHLNILSYRTEYLSNVCMDSWLRHRDIVRELAKYDLDTKDHRHHRITYFKRALEYEANFYRQQTIGNPDNLTGASFALDCINHSLARDFQL